MKILHSHFRQTICAVVAVTLLWTQALKAQSGYAYETKKKGILGLFGKDNQNQASDKQTLFNVLKDLNKQKGVYFLFSDPLLGNKPVNPVADMQATIDKILDQVLKNTGLKYKKVSDNAFVILASKETSKKTGTPVDFQQDKTVNYSDRAMRL
ncbi:MAG TPA: STN domain-containing protein, partial [Chitinophagaceae bacterium]|nr:STN domain-containing protein [Chitinophagaceae bacterium]